MREIVKSREVRVCKTQWIKEENKECVCVCVIVSIGIWIRLNAVTVTEETWVFKAERLVFGGESGISCFAEWEKGKKGKKEGAGDVLKDICTRGGMRDPTVGNRWRDMGDVGCVLWRETRDGG